MFKHQGRHTLVLGAAVLATGLLAPTISGAVPRRVVRQPPVQFWEFREFRADGSDAHVAGNGTLENPALGDGSPLEAIIDWGRAQFDLDPDPPDFRANGRVFASSTGATFGVQAQSPTGNVSDPQSRIGDTTRLVQYQAFVKDTEDATLTFVVSAVRIDVLDVNGTDVPLAPQCPAQTPSVQTCQGTMEGQAIYSVRAYDADGTFYNTSGGAKVTGWEGEFQPSIWKDSFARAPFWSPRNFTFDPAVNGPTDPSRASLTLNGSVRLRVDLSSVPVGGLFAVRADAIASAYDRRGSGEGSGVVVFLQDPLEANGTNIRVRGAHAVPDPLIIPPPDDPAPPVECPAGPDPRAGTLQFSAPSNGVGEWTGAGPAVVVTHEGGSRGAVTATLTSSDGTATAGTDYTPVSTTVTFADGERTPQAVTVPITPDLVPEDDETVHLTLSDPVCTTLGARPETDLTIVDDDRPIVPPPSFAIGGTVHGLEGHGLDLASLGQHVVSDADGAFQFPERLPDGSGYDVEVAAQPTAPDQVCTVTNGTGTIAAADVTDIDVECTTPPPVAGLDPTFGGDGRVTTGGLPSGRAVVVQADGKVVVAGDHFLSRYLGDGSLDPDFGTAGTVLTGVDTAFFDDAVDVALQPDGMIVVAGVTSGGTNEDFAVERYDANGVADPGFGTAGRVTTDFHGGSDRAYGVAILPDGRIVVAGHAATDGTGADNDYALARYEPDGTPDSSLGGTGTVTTNIAGAADFGHAVALRPDGAIVVAGRVSSSGGTGEQFGIVQYHDDGQLDTSFGIGGIAIPPFVNGGIADGIALQPDGKIVVTGTVAGDVALARLEPQGATDATFGTDGLVTTDFGLIDGVFPATELAHDLVVQPDGRIVVVGTSQFNGSGDLAVVRYDATGTPDPGFDGDGILTIDFAGGFDAGNDVALQPDGKIVAVGSARSGFSVQTALARING